MLRLLLASATTALLLTPACATEEVPFCEENPDDPTCECWDAAAGEIDMACECMRDPGAPACTVDAGDGGDTGMDGDTAVDGDAGPCGGGCASPLMCRTSDDRCVECLMDTDCTDVTAAKCSAAGACEACDDSTQCAGIGTTSICADTGPSIGSCVVCTEADTTACMMDHPCNPLSNTCSMFEMASAGTCETCDTDTNCRSAGARCVQMNFMGVDRDGYCLPEVPMAGMCPQQYRTLIRDAMSLSGAPAADYCSPDQASISCEALRALGQPCAMCTGVDGSLCETIPGSGEVCTYPCGAASDCPMVGSYTTCDTGAGGYCGS